MFLFLAAALAATPAATADYSAGRWLRSAFAVTPEGVLLRDTFDAAAAPVPWAVFDGAGRMVPVETFAADTDDRGMLRRFEKEDGRVATKDTLLTVVAIVASSAGLTAAGPPDYPTPATGNSPQQSPAWAAITAHRTVSAYYTPELADELIRRHNGGLRRKLGLSPEEAAALDRGPIAPEPGPGGVTGAGAPVP